MCRKYFAPTSRPLLCCATVSLVNEKTIVFNSLTKDGFNLAKYTPDLFFRHTKCFRFKH